MGVRRAWRRGPVSRAPQARPAGGQRGAVVVELSIVAILLASIIFSAIDLGRTAQYQNRMYNALREGAAIAQLSPTSVNTGCRGDRNVIDRVRKQNPALASIDGYTVTVAKQNANGTLTPYTGCSTTTPTLTFAAGDRVIITLRLRAHLSGPISQVVEGDDHITLTRQIEVVVQG